MVRSYTVNALHCDVCVVCACIVACTVACFIGFWGSVFWWKCVLSSGPSCPMVRWDGTDSGDMAQCSGTHRSPLDGPSRPMVEISYGV